MIYIISARAYWRYIEELGLTHEELIIYLNRSINPIAPITEVHISKEDVSK